VAVVPSKQSFFLPLFLPSSSSPPSCLLWNFHPFYLFSAAITGMRVLTCRASCFENVTSVIFLASLADYNSGIIEDRNSNGMQEALMLWGSIVNSQCESCREQAPNASLSALAARSFLSCWNRLQLSLTPTGFLQSSMILFLNKADLLMEKIRDPHQQVKTFFPEFEGTPGSYHDAVDFFKSAFRYANNSSTKEIYTQ
jgi:guanine nucleotide-binding protein subunit alpha